MTTWFSFFFFTFWISIFIFFISNSNLVTILIFSELIWIILYCLFLITSLYYDDLILLSFSFFSLGFAALEFSIGILLVVLFKQTFNAAEFSSTQPQLDKNLLFFFKKN